MKTSPTQFDMLITFMEANGDLLKPPGDARGRLRNLSLWEDLTSLLNSDATGETKNMDRWKKVWSDLKNNTKRKAARIHKAATGTGGGPALHIKLTDLEERVLQIIGIQAATGLDVEEAGVVQEAESPPPPSRGTPPPPTPRETPPPLSPHCNIDNIVLESVREEWNEAGPSRRPHIPPPISAAAVQQAPVTPPPIPPSTEGHTPRRRTAPRGRSPRQRAPRMSPRGRLRRGARTTDQVAQDFLQSDVQFQELRRMELNNERERLRLLDIQLQIQRDWQRVGATAVTLLEKIVDKFCKD